MIYILVYDDRKMIERTKGNITCILKNLSSNKENHTVFDTYKAIFKLYEYILKEPSVQILVGIFDILRNLCTSLFIEQFSNREMVEAIVNSIIKNIKFPPVHSQGEKLLNKLSTKSKEADSVLSEMLWKRVKCGDKLETEILCTVVSSINETKPVIEIFPEERITEMQVRLFGKNSERSNFKSCSLNLLHACCLLNFPEIGLQLLTNGSDPNYMTKGTTVLSCLQLSLCNSLEDPATVSMLNVLLEKGARVKVVNGLIEGFDKKKSALILEYCSSINFSANNLNTVKELDLSGCGIKVVPKILKKFVNLESLDLSHNLLQTLPKFLCRFKNLKNLNITGNEKLEQLGIPNEIGELLKKLKDVSDHQEIDNAPIWSSKANIIALVPSAIEKGNLVYQIEERYKHLLGEGRVIVFPWSVDSIEREISFFGNSVYLILFPKNAITHCEYIELFMRAIKRELALKGMLGKVFNCIPAILTPDDPSSRQVIFNNRQVPLLQIARQPNGNKYNIKNLSSLDTPLEKIVKKVRFIEVPKPASAFLARIEALRNEGKVQLSYKKYVEHFKSVCKQECIYFKEKTLRNLTEKLHCYYFQKISSLF